jgi:hypothetical protein
MERVEGRSWQQRLGALFTINASQRRFLEDLDKANTGGFELVLTPMILAGIGVLLARVVGGGLLLPFAFGFVGLAGTVYRLILDYKARMKQAEEGKPWAK